MRLISAILLSVMYFERTAGQDVSATGLSSRRRVNLLKNLKGKKSGEVYLNMVPRDAFSSV